MKQLLWLLKWILKAAIFFTLFAFALNNQQDATVHFFFGQQWRLPMVLIVLIAFALGLTVGVLGMVPLWWRRRARREASPPTPSTESGTSGFSTRMPLPPTAGDEHGI